MKQLLPDEIVQHREAIENSIKEVVTPNSVEIERIMDLLALGALHCWLLLRSDLCIGYAITEVIYDNITNKNLLLVYMTRTLETATPVEIHRFYNDLLDEARKNACAALTFYSSFQNEKKYEGLRKYGAIVRTHYYIPVGE